MQKSSRLSAMFCFASCHEQFFFTALPYSRALVGQAIYDPYEKRHVSESIVGSLGAHVVESI
jgi:hypothetical protein